MFYKRGSSHEYLFSLYKCIDSHTSILAINGAVGSFVSNFNGITYAKI